MIFIDGSDRKPGEKRGIPPTDDGRCPKCGAEPWWHTIEDKDGDKDDDDLAPAPAPE